MEANRLLVLMTPESDLTVLSYLYRGAEGSGRCEGGEERTTGIPAEESTRFGKI